MTRRCVLFLSWLFFGALAKFVLLMNPYALAIFKARSVLFMKLDFRIIDALHRVCECSQLYTSLAAVAAAVVTEMSWGTLLNWSRTVIIRIESLSCTVFIHVFVVVLSL